MIAKKTSILFILSLLLKLGVMAQHVDYHLIVPLPDSMRESSGIAVISAERFWTHNDSGDSARLFLADTAGNLIRTLWLRDIHAVDCEDLARDSGGNLYLGDFGNNLNERHDLRIYVISGPDTAAADSLNAGIITFQYPDQSAWPPDSSRLNFDCEAMFHYQDHLYLFSKNRGISTYSRMYRLPDSPGNYTAVLLDSFNTEQWVTSADISPDGEKMVLLSETNIWLFRNFSGDDFFGGDVSHLTMYFSQKEAVGFVNDTILYITDEVLFGFGGNLYEVNVASWVNGLEEKETRAGESISVFPNPTSGSFRVCDGRNHDLNSAFTLFDLSGRFVMRMPAGKRADISILAPGAYILMVDDTGNGLSGCVLLTKY